MESPSKPKLLRPPTLILPNTPSYIPVPSTSQINDIQNPQLTIDPSVQAVNDQIVQEIINNSIQLQENMAQFDVKTLCIIPEYDGNPNELYQFINAATLVLNEYWKVQDPGCFQNRLLTQGIANKLRGRAKDVITVYGCTDWHTIKETLIQNFADQRNENSLTRDLVNLRQNQNETPQQFHEKIMGLLNTISNYIELHTPDEEIKASKKNFFQQQALSAFLAGLREPIGSTIRAMRPPNLTTAIQYIQEEDNIRYLQKGYSSPPPQITKKPVFLQKPFQPNLQQMIPQFNQQMPHRFNTQPPRFNSPLLQRPMQPQFYQPSFRPQWQQSNPFNQRQNFQAPKPIDQPRFQQNFQQNLMNRPGPSQFSKPTPMSISTRNTNGPPTRSMRVQPPINPAALYNIEQYDEATGFDLNSFDEDNWKCQEDYLVEEQVESQTYHFDEEANFPMDPGNNQET